MKLKMFALCLLVTVVSCASPAGAPSSNVSPAPGTYNVDALWEIIQKCAASHSAGQGPGPCESVNVSGGTVRGYAVLKDIRGATHFLLLPLRKLRGIGEPDL